MKRYYKAPVKLTAVVLSLMMVISAFSGLFGAFTSYAVDEGDFVIYDTTNNIINDSVVDGAAVTKFKKDSEPTVVSFSSVGKLTDGNFTNEFEAYYSGAPFFDMKNGVSADSKTFSNIETWYLDGSQRYLEIVLPIKDNATISDILVINHADANLMTGRYVIYASANENDLFTDANKVKDYDNTAAKKQKQDFHFGEGKELQGIKYVGMRIYNPVTDVSESAIGSYVTQYGAQIIYPRLLEFNVYGTMPASDFSVDKSDDSNEIPSGTSAVSAVESKFFKDGVEVYADDANSANILKLTDGDASGEIQYMMTSNVCTYKDAEGNVFTDGRAFNEFTFTMKNNYSVEKMVILHHSDSRLKTGKYTIYMSDDKETLYTNPQKTYTYDNTTANKRRQVISFNDGDGFTYKYVGVRIDNPVKDIDNLGLDWTYAVTRLFELNFYGSKVGNTGEEVYTFETDDKAEIPEGTNILQGVTASSVTYYSRSGPAPFTLNDRISRFTDGDVETEFYLSNEQTMASGSKADGNLKVLTEKDGFYADVVFDLETIDAINKFFVVNHPTQAIRLNHYKVFAANEESQLFNQENLVADVYSEGARRNIVTFNSEVTARYIGFRASDVLYDKNWDQASDNTVYLRVMEFGLIGTKGTAAEQKLELSENNDNATCIQEGKETVASSYSAYYTNPLTKERNQVSLAKGWGNQSESAFTSLTDNIMTNQVEAYGSRFAANDGTADVLYTKGEAKLDIVYTLKGVTNISDVVVVLHENPILRSGSYELYASNDENTIFDSGNLIYKFVNTDKKRTQHFTVASGKTVTAKFFAMRITSATTVTEFSEVGLDVSAIYPRLYQFNVYGEVTSGGNVAELQEASSMQLPAGTSVVKSVTNQFDSGDGRGPQTTTVGDDSKLTDGELSSGEFMGGTSQGGNCFAYDDNGTTKYYDNRTHDIIYELKGVATVNKIFVFNHPDPDLMTQKYKIYASQTLDSLFLDESLVYDYENTNDMRAQLFTLPENFKAKYVAMRVTQPCKNAGFGADVANSYLRLLEFDVYGTEGSGATEPGGDAGTTLPEGNNFLLGKSASAVTYSLKNGDSIVHSVSSNLNDGNTDNEWYAGTTNGHPMWVQKNATTGLWERVTDGSVYTDITFTLGGTAKLEKLYIAHHSSPDLRTGKFEVYASENEANLFDESNKVSTVQNPGYRANLLTFETPLEGIRAIGIRVLDPCYDYSSGTLSINQDSLNANDNATNIYARIFDIAAFGAYEADPFQFQKVTNMQSAVIPAGIDLSVYKNLSSLVNPKLYFYDTVEETSRKASSRNLDNMTDGDLNSETEINNQFASWDENEGKAVYDHNTGRYYLDIVYDFKSLADLNYIVVGNHSTRELVTGEYEVFIGNDKATLFDSEPYVSINNIEAYNEGKSNRVNFIAFDKTDESVVSKAQYVGIRIKNPVCKVGEGVTEVTETQNNIYPRLFELSVYGTYLDPEFDPSSNVRQLTDTKGYDLASLSKNGPSLIRGKDTVILIGGKKETSTDAKIKIRDVVDGDYNLTHKDLTNGYTEGQDYTLYWPLRIDADSETDAVQINGFVFQGISENNDAYYTSHYQISVAEDIEDLFKDDTIVFEYNVDNDDPLMKGCVYYFPEGQKPIGNYVGIKILNPVYTATQHVYPRISILKFWGEGMNIPGAPGNLAENMPINANFINGSKKTAISEANLTPTEVRNLTDSNTSTYANITTNKSSRKTVELTYNLCGDMKIDSIWASALINSNTGFKKMKVYASSGIAEVNDESSLIWTYSVGSKTGTLKPTKTFATQLKARYVRFVFEGTKDYLKIGEIYVNGLDNQKNKTRILTNIMSADDIDITRTNIKTNKTTIINTYHSPYMIDNDPTSYMVFHDVGVVGEDFYTITFDLQELRTVSKFTLRFQRYFERYWPGTINVYLIETPIDLENKDVKPDYVIKKSDIGKSGTWEKYIRPALARYVRLEIKDFEKNPEYLTTEGQYMISTMINDFLITGTKVKGMQTGDSEELLTFESEKNNAAVSVLRLDENDVFADVVEMKMTAEKATNWQMRSLESTPYMKILDKTVYKIELLDLYGNKVEDFKGRDIKVSFKIPDGYEIAEISIGNATNRTLIDVLDTNFDGKYAYAIFPYTPGADNKVALLATTTSDDEYWGTIGELEDFSEGNKEDWTHGKDEEKDAEYYRWIHTDDNRFQVAGVTNELDEGAIFTAKDISSSVADSEYETVLELAEGKKVAVFYDMKLTTKSGKTYDLAGDFVDIKLNIPDFIYDNFTDLQILHIDDEGTATLLWSEVADREFTFQTGTFSHFAIIGTALDGSSSIGDGSEGEIPTTGETAGAMFAAILAMAAAAFVAIRFGKRVKR